VIACEALPSTSYGQARAEMFGCDQALLAVDQTSVRGMATDTTRSHETASRNQL
jgi:hypothetical protein